MRNNIIKGEIVFARLLLPAIAGIILACQNGIRIHREASFITIGILLSLICACCLKYRELRIYNIRWLPGMLVQLFLFVVSFTIAQNQTIEEMKGEWCDRLKPDALIGTISNEPRLTGQTLKFQMEIRQAVYIKKVEGCKGRILVALRVSPAGMTGLKYGAQVLIPNKCTSIDPPLNPNEFDYRQYLHNLGIYHRAFLDSKEIVLLESNTGNLAISYANELRGKMVKAFNEYIPDREAAGLASTLILGYRADLSSSILQAYSKTGTMHVLSVSGMHVALVLGLLNFLLSFMDRWRPKWPKSLLIISFISLYALVTGFSPSVCRAALMISLLVIGRNRNRKANSYNLIAASALILLIINPGFIRDVGFQLSYLAVFGLIYLYPKIYGCFYFENYFADKIWSYIALSLAAQLFTAPLSIYYFHQFPVYFLLSNLLIVIPISLIMYSGLVFLLLYSISWFIPVVKGGLPILGVFLGKSIGLTNRCLFYIENLPGATLSFYPYSFWFYLLTFSTLVCLVIALQLRSKYFFYVFFLQISIVSVYTSYHSIYRQNQKIITFYSLRKQTAISFLNRGKATVLTSLDPSNESFAFSIKPHLTAFSNDIKTLKIGENERSQLFYSQPFICFFGYRILIYGKDLNKKVFTARIPVEDVLLTENCRVKLQEIVNFVKFKRIIIDGTNSDFKINSWLKEAANLKINCYVLKRNKALVIPL